MKIVFVFRGRNTDQIIEDAVSAGIIGDDDACYVVCVDDDPLRQMCDILVGKERSKLKFLIRSEEEIVVVCNGGTTAQLVSVVVMVTRYAGSYKLYDLQKGKDPVLLDEAG